MMLEIGVQPHEALVAGRVDAGSRVPAWRRRLALDAQVALGAAFGGRMHHVDRAGPATCPLRSFQISAAASPLAAIEACAAASTRNDDGSTVRAGQRDGLSAADGSPPASVQRSARISRGVFIVAPQTLLSSSAKADDPDSREPES